MHTEKGRRKKEIKEKPKHGQDEELTTAAAAQVNLVRVLLTTAFD